MLLASNSHEKERAAVSQRYQLDSATSGLEAELYVLTGQVRQYVIDGNPAHLIVYNREVARLSAVEERLNSIENAGAAPSELTALAEAFRWANTLHDEQSAAIEANKKGQLNAARDIMFGAEYERQLERSRTLLERFRAQVDQRTAAAITTATNVSRAWRTTSEITLAITAFVFFCVLYFLFKKRVLRPVVKLSDVVSRLAVQDYDVPLPTLEQVDEIGDMAQAISIFRENGLARRRLEHQRDADAATRELLARMTQRMQGCDNQQDLSAVVRRFVPEIAPDLAGRLYLLDENRNVMVEVCDWLSPLHSRTEFTSISCWALRRGVMHRPADNIDVPCEHLDATQDHVLNTICLPLTAQRETLGLLYLEPKSSQLADRQATPEIYLNMLAENISLALANLRLRETLRSMAMSDPLTGLANRRALDQVLALEAAEAERVGRPLSCAIIDVDHFKRFNDQFGHDAGDAVLKALGDLLTKSTREDGMAFRYGGEEFVLLMPGLNCDQATARAEQLRKAITALSVQHEETALGTITASMGVACFPDKCTSNRLIQVADAALLRAKESGRNRVEVADARERRNVNSGPHAA